MEGGTIGDESLRSRGLWYGWEQNSLGIEPPLDAVSLEDMGQRFATRGKYSRIWQAHMRAWALMDLASSTMLWESTGQAGTRRHRTRT